MRRKIGMLTVAIALIALTTLTLAMQKSSKVKQLPVIAGWEQVSTVPANATSLVWQGLTLFVGTQNSGAYASTDFGATFTQINSGFPAPVQSRGLGVYQLYVSNGRVLCKLKVWGTGAGTRTFYWAGALWIESPNAGANITYYNGDHVLTSDGSVIAAGEYEMRRSTDNGATFGATSITSYFASGSGAGYGNAAVFGLASAGNTIYAATEHDGVSFSTDNGASWSWLGVYETHPGQIWPFGNAHVMKSNAAGELVVGASQGQVFISTTTTAVQCVPDTTPATQYSPCLCLPVNGGSGCGSWIAASGYPSTYLGEENQVQDLLLLSNGDMLLHGGRIYRSHDGGRSWSLDDANIPAGRLNYTGALEGQMVVAHHTMAIGPDGLAYVAIPQDGYGVWRYRGEGVPSPSPTVVPTPSPTPSPSPSPGSQFLYTLNCYLESGKVNCRQP